MANIPYLTKTSAVKDFLKKIQETGEPSKVTIAYLKTIGFTSSNDQPLLPVFKFLGFLDSSGAPTDLYRKYRNKKEAPKVLGRAVSSAYSGLYATYPDAHKRDAEALANYFRESTGLGERAVSAIVNTFKTLSESADFEGLEELGEVEEEIRLAPKKKVAREIGRAHV